MTGALYQPFPMVGRARAQVWRHAPQFQRPRHFHREPELNLIVAGTATFAAGDAALPVTVGDLLWWAPGQDHELLSCSRDFDLFVVGVTPELSDRVLTAGSPLAGPTRLRLTPERLAQFRETCAAPLGGDPGSAERHLGDLWLEAHVLRMWAPGKHALTRRALRTLAEDPAHGRSEVAVRAHAHPSEISRHFHEDMCLTLTRYRTRLRLLRFIEAVDGGAESLLSAALDAGFGSYSQCHRAFQQTIGCTPRSFFGPGVRAAMGAACK